VISTVGTFLSGEEPLSEDLVASFLSIAEQLGGQDISEALRRDLEGVSTAARSFVGCSPMELIDRLSDRSRGPARS